MRTISMLLVLAVLSAGCSSGENPASVCSDHKAEITANEVVVIAQGTDDLGDESFWIVCSVGAQLLESKYERYRAAGLGEADFARMPDNQLTGDITRLYLDMKPLIQ